VTSFRVKPFSRAYLNQFSYGFGVGVGDEALLIGPPLEVLGKVDVQLRAEVLLLVHVGADKSGQLGCLRREILSIRICSHFVCRLHKSEKVKKTIHFSI